MCRPIRQTIVFLRIILRTVCAEGVTGLAGVDAKPATDIQGPPRRHRPSGVYSRFTAGELVSNCQFHFLYLYLFADCFEFSKQQLRRFNSIVKILDKI
jgi:hypothetical protein